MHPADCPQQWEYDGHPRRAELFTRSRQVLIDLRRNALEAAAVAADSRPVHSTLFDGLTPVEAAYFAGHYRGEDFRCLRYWDVQIQGDPRVGLAASKVVATMAAVGRQIRASIIEFDRSPLSPEHKVAAIVAVACRIFELVLRIHPYANGNGHAARIIITAILGRYGYWIRNFPADPRPPDPPYTDLITRYRDGDPRPLEEYVLRSILGL
jgi:fido (protein-threonine AMPylation protein)